MLFTLENAGAAIRAVRSGTQRTTHLPYGKGLEMNLRLAIGVVVGLVAAQFFAAASGAQEKTAKKPSELKSVKDKAAYAIGANSGASIRHVNENQSLGLDPEIILRGFRDALGSGKLQLSDEEKEDALQKLQDDVAERNAAAGDAFLAANKTKAGVKTLSSGLQYKVLKKGTGKKPRINDQVVVHYRGKTVDGKQFESSYDTNQPVTLPVNGVIPGWSEALLLMEVGSKWEIAIPADLAYGPEPREKFGPNSSLVFDLELVDIAKATPQLPAGNPPVGPKGKPAVKPEEIEN
jgi:FKBP-type peptidyl-prolyl cis-trans isomerase